LARVFKDGNSTKYDATNAKFDTVNFGTFNNPGADGIMGTTDDPATTMQIATPYTAMAWPSTAGFAQKVDNSVVGNMMDCGECHVGGGMMEYMPNGYSAAGTPGDPSANAAVSYDPSKRLSLREKVFGSAVTAFNYFIDIFGLDGLGYETHNHDGSVRNVAANKPTYAPVMMNYSTAGVMEMDCLMCHKNDYSWEKRKEAIRTGKFDASRAYGAGLATKVVNGRQVFYNSTSVTKNANGELTVNLSNLSGMPASNNCVSCHMGTEENKYQVEWKKRGEMWTAGKEVHMGIGCMGCHERNDNTAAATGTTGIASGAAANAKLGLCDPAKGKTSPFEALWNAVDDKSFKDCTDCHSSTTNVGTSQNYGAPDMEAIHAVFGLSSSAKGGKIAFKADGSRASHLDIIDCTACHVRKSGFSGGAFVDGTGVDLEGRLATHDTEDVARQHENDGVAFHWLSSNPRPGKPSERKIYAANLLTSFFWRDMNALNKTESDGTTLRGGFDANNDGREGGMDPFLPTHIAKINDTVGTKSIFSTRPTTAAVITANQNAILRNIESLLGIAPGTYTGGDASVATASTSSIIPKLSFLVVPFKASHNIAPASQAWGAGGCTDCHGANKGFYNGQYPINGKQAKLVNGAYTRVNGPTDTDFTFNSNQVTIYSKVNGTVDESDTHPNVMNKKGTRSVPVKILSMFDNAYAAAPTTSQYLRDIDQGEMLYEATFQTRDTTFYDSITGSPITPACTVKTAGPSPFYCAPGTAIANPDGLANIAATMAATKHVTTATKGWLLKVEVDTDPAVTTDDIVTRTVMVMNDKVTNTDELVTALGAVGGTYFTVENASGALKLTALNGAKIRISDQTDVAPLGLKGKIWKADPIVRAGVGTFNTRAEYVTYLNSLGAAPVAVVGTIGGTSATATSGSSSATPILLTQNASVALTTTDAGANFSYTWYANGKTATGASTSMTFANTGTYLLTLTTKNLSTGITATQSKYVKVTAPAPAALTAPTVTAVAATKMGSFTLSMPAHTRIYITWGDGGATNIVDSNSTYAASHKYYGAAAGKLFRTTVKVFDGTVLKQAGTFDVQF
jgi:hypothetical protein